MLNYIVYNWEQLCWNLRNPQLSSANYNFYNTYNASLLLETVWKFYNNKLYPQRLQYILIMKKLKGSSFNWFCHKTKLKWVMRDLINRRNCALNIRNRPIMINAHKGKQGYTLYWTSNLFNFTSSNTAS